MNLWIVFGITSMECDGLQIEAAAYIYSHDNILKGGYDAFYSHDMLLLKGEGCVNGIEG